MVKLNKLTDYALIIICELDLENNKSAKLISKATHIPIATTNKVLKALLKNNLCQARIGKNGGFRLIKSHDEISVLDVVAAIEGKIFSFTECSRSSVDCSLKNTCKIVKKMISINEEIQILLKTKTLKQLMN